MIYMEPASLGWRPVFISWLHNLPPTLTDTHKKLITELFERFVDPCIAYLRKGGLKELSPTSDPNLVRSLMNILDCQFDKFQDPKKFASYVTKEVFAWLEGMFLFALIWSIGITGETNSRVKFDLFLRKIIVSGVTDEEKKDFGLLDPVPPPPKPYTATLPDALTIYHYKFISELSVGFQFENMSFYQLNFIRMKIMLEKNQPMRKKVINIGNHGPISFIVFHLFQRIHFSMKLLLKH
jgi:dynein heavy chain